MPSAKQMQDLAAAFEAHQARLARARDAATGPLREQLSQSHTLLTQTMKDLTAGVEKQNQELAQAAKSAQDALADAKKKSAELLANAPKPKPRPATVGVVHDPHLEEKLQLALRTPFGNRGTSV